MKRFTSVQDMVDGPGLKSAIETAHAIAEDPYVYHGEGARKTLGLLFMNPSLRTRMSTQIAANRLGMDVELYEEPANWRQQQQAVLEGLLASEQDLVAEKDRLTADHFMALANGMLSAMPKRRYVEILARRR